MNTDLTFLTTDGIKDQAPVIFAGGPTREVSERYVYADTPTIINDMDKLGWKVRQVGQRKARKEATSFSPHFVSCLLYTSPSPRDRQKSRMPSSA